MAGFGSSSSTIDGNVATSEYSNGAAAINSNTTISENGERDHVLRYHIRGFGSSSSTIDGNVTTSEYSNGAAVINSNMTISENGERDDSSSDYYIKTLLCVVVTGGSAPSLSR